MDGGSFLGTMKTFSNEGTPKPNILREVFNKVDGGKLEPKLDALIIVDHDCESCLSHQGH